MVVVPETHSQLFVLNSLSEENFKIFIADSLSKAFIEGLKHSVNMVIASHQLPDGNPMELFDRFRLIGRKIPFLILGENKEKVAPGVEYATAEAPIVSKVRRLLDEMPQIATQRSHPRYTCNFDVYFESVQNGIMSMSKSTNLSGGGMFMATSYNLPDIGEFVAFRILASPGPFTEIEGIGVVRWRRERENLAKPSGFAIEFVDLTYDAQIQVGELLSKIASADTLIPDNSIP